MRVKVTSKSKGDNKFYPTVTANELDIANAKRGERYAVIASETDYSYKYVLYAVVNRGGKYPTLRFETYPKNFARPTLGNPKFITVFATQLRK